MLSIPPSPNGNGVNILKESTEYEQFLNEECHELEISGLIQSFYDGVREIFSSCVNDDPIVYD